MTETKIGYEIDFLPVGNGSRNGDAIAVRYGIPGNYKVMVFDGGTKESGAALVEHVKKYYKTDHVDYVVNTHPDADHASGLLVVLENLSVGELWLHRPWEHSKKICDAFKDGRITDNSLSERLKDALNHACALEKFAIDNDIPIYEPFQGAKIGEFVVLSPSKKQYQELIPEFNKSPEQKEAGLLGKIAKSITEAVNYIIEEKWDLETLSNSAETSGENESSVILYANIDGRGILLTGDAGAKALTWAADYSDSYGINLAECRFVQVPHHGSRNNVTPSVLDRILGPKQDEKASFKTTSFASVSAKCETHPRRRVVNAFIRRGAKVIVTKGSTKHHYHNMDAREGWITAEPLPFYQEVEE